LKVAMYLYHYRRIEMPLNHAFPKMLNDLPN